MNDRIRTFLRSALILIVAIGPLQAQVVFACSMMDMVMEECCCDEQLVGDAALESNDEPCCEQSVEVQVDQDAHQDSQLIKPIEIRSDVDPPQSIVNSFNANAALQERSSPVVYRPRPTSSFSGTDTYLITQRLRI